MSSNLNHWLTRPKTKEKWTNYQQIFKKHLRHLEPYLRIHNFSEIRVPLISICQQEILMKKTIHQLDVRNKSQIWDLHKSCFSRRFDFQFNSRLIVFVRLRCFVIQTEKTSSYKEHFNAFCSQRPWVNTSKQIRAKVSACLRY